MVILKEVIVYFDEDDPHSGFINFTHNDNNYKLLITVEETGEVGKNNSDHMYLMYKDGDIVKMKLKGMGATPRIITKLENIVEYLNKIDDGLFCNLYHIVKEKNAKYFSGKKVNKTNTNKINKIYRIIEEMDKFYESNCKNKNFSSINQFNNTYLEENLTKNKYFKMFINEQQNNQLKSNKSQNNQQQSNKSQNNQPQSNKSQNNQQKSSNESSKIKLDLIIKEYTEAYIKIRNEKVTYSNDLNKLEKNLHDLNERKDQITKYINEYNRTTFHSYVTELENLYKLYNRLSYIYLQSIERLKSVPKKNNLNKKSASQTQQSVFASEQEKTDFLNYVEDKIKSYRDDKKIILQIENKNAKDLALKQFDEKINDSIQEIIKKIQLIYNLKNQNSFKPLLLTLKSKIRELLAI